MGGQMMESSGAEHNRAYALWTWVTCCWVTMWVEGAGVKPHPTIQG